MTAKTEGQCYLANGTAIIKHLDGEKKVTEAHAEIVLVHGYPTLTVEPFVKYGHAWIEIAGLLVYDAESGVMHSRNRYYEIGKIDFDECVLYTPEETRSMILEHEHWGPWEEIDVKGDVQNGD